MLGCNLIYNRPTESGSPYYVTDRNGDSNVDAKNTDNPECMTDNESDESENLHTIVISNGKFDKRSENLDKILFQSECIVSLKAGFLTLKNFVMEKINTISEKLNSSTHPNNEYTLYQEQIKHSREENSSMNLITKILSEN